MLKHSFLHRAAGRISVAIAALPRRQKWGTLAGGEIGPTIAVNRRLPGDHADTLSIEPYGLIHLVGWTFAGSAELASSIELELPSGVRTPCQVFRTFRLDVAAQYGPRALRSGFSVDFGLGRGRECHQDTDLLLRWRQSDYSL